MSINRLLAYGPSLSPDCRGVWVELGQQVVIDCLGLCFTEDVWDDKRILHLQVRDLVNDFVPGFFRLPVDQPIRFRQLAQVSLFPRATRERSGRVEAVYLEYVVHSRRSADAE